MATQAYGRNKAARKVLRISGKEPELPCLVIPTDRHDLLLPRSVIEEVVDFEQPVPVESAPPWLLGHIEWADRQVPLVSFGALIDGTEIGIVRERSRIVILKSLNAPGRVPWLGLLLAGLPRPVTVKPADLVEAGDEKKSLGVFRRVKLGEGEAIVPELDRLTHLVTHATFGALPITQLDD
jgi:chemosensory pili system protein ChpC